MHDKRVGLYGNLNAASDHFKIKMIFVKYFL